MVVGDGAQALDGGNDRRLEGLGQARQLLPGAGPVDAAAGPDDGRLGAGQGAGRLLHQGRLRARRGNDWDGITQGTASESTLPARWSVQTSTWVGRGRSTSMVRKASWRTAGMCSMPLARAFHLVTALKKPSWSLGS